MKLDKLYAVDEDSFENGKWLVTRNGLDVKVRSMNHPDFKKRVVELQKPHLAILTSKVDSTNLLEKITIRAMAEKLLLDWKDEEEYSVEKGIQYLTRYPEFNEDISVLCSNMDNYRPEIIAEK